MLSQGETIAAMVRSYHVSGPKPMIRPNKSSVSCRTSSSESASPLTSIFDLVEITRIPTIKTSNGRQPKLSQGKFQDALLVDSGNDQR